MTPTTGSQTLSAQPLGTALRPPHAACPCGGLKAALMEARRRRVRLNERQGE